MKIFIPSSFRELIYKSCYLFFCLLSFLAALVNQSLLCLLVPRKLFKDLEALGVQFRSSFQTNYVFFFGLVIAEYKHFQSLQYNVKGFELWKFVKLWKLVKVKSFNVKRFKFEPVQHVNNK